MPFGLLVRLLSWGVCSWGLVWSPAALALSELNLTKEAAEISQYKSVDWQRKPNSPLAQAKYFEFEGRGEDCLKALASARVPGLESWIELQKLRCHFWVIKKQKSPKAWGTFKKFLQSSSLLKSPKKILALAWEDLDGFLLAHGDELDPWFLELLADSLEHLHSRDRERVLNLLARKKDLWPEWVASVRLSGPATPSLPAAKEDLNFIFKSPDKTQNSPALDSLAQYLSEFPGGERAKSLEVELRTRLQKGDSQWNREFLSLRADLQLELVATLVKKESAPILAKWLKGFRERREPLNASQWLTLGRQAQIFGLWDEAKLLLTIVTERYSQNSEAAEALFRRALVNIRLSLWTAAQNDLSGLLEHPRWSLSAGYWLVQVLKKGSEAEKARALETAKLMVERYPLSYYGMRLREDFSWPLSLSPPPPAASEKWLLTAQDVEAWKRAKLLMKYGWTREANHELRPLPWPVDPGSLWRLSQTLAARGVYQQAISSHSALSENSMVHRLPQNLAVYFPKVWEKPVALEAQRQKLSPYLVWGLMRQESAFDERATSTSSALGLMQLLFSTAKEVATSFAKNLLDAEDVYLPANNIQFGTRYIAQMIDLCRGSVPLALAAYNAGPGRMQQWFRLRDDLKVYFEGTGLSKEAAMDPLSELWVDELPLSEPSFYVKAVLRNALIYRWLYSGSPPSQTKGLGQWSDLQSRGF